ncbi:unnamed protein product [Diabrotica balteata]|uniref:Reverse transcriptase domain-containing protein n=1 Tax=Diabrotica balteata TaxID=107213 RepID=A0A9N9X7M7_DIABA|nr:unnamed protein product [Diabrotica balteata]
MVQRLHAGDEIDRLEFCRWINNNRPTLYKTLFTDEAQFTTDGINNSRNSHVWAEENPHAIRERRSQLRFSVNVWIGVINNQLVGPHFFDGPLTGQFEMAPLPDDSVQATPLPSNFPREHPKAAYSDGKGPVKQDIVWYNIIRAIFYHTLLLFGVWKLVTLQVMWQTVLFVNNLKIATRYNNKKSKISAESKNMLKQRKELLSLNKRSITEYKELNRAIRKQIKDDIKKHQQEHERKILSITIKKSTRPTYLERYTELYRSRNDSPDSSKQNLRRQITNVNSEVMPEISEVEIENAIKEMKRNKAPGNIPKEWNTANTILIHKKGDNTDLKNYRPISLLSQLYKTFTKIITNRLTTKFDVYQPVEQAGFRKGFSTCDHFHTLKVLIEKVNEYNLPICLAFIDYEKAFDSIELWAIEEALVNSKIDSRYRILIPYSRSPYSCSHTVFVDTLSQD